MASIYTERMSVPRRDETARIAIARADTPDPVIQRGGVRYCGEAKVRRGAKDSLEVSISDMILRPLRWQGGATG
jgi:hypothetical protein